MPQKFIRAPNWKAPGPAEPKTCEKRAAGCPKDAGSLGLLLCPNQVAGIEKIEDFAKEFAKEIEADALAAQQECAAESKVLCKETVVEGTARFGRAVPELD